MAWYHLDEAVLVVDHGDDDPGLVGHDLDARLLADAHQVGGVLLELELLLHPGRVEVVADQLALVVDVRPGGALLQALVEGLRVLVVEGVEEVHAVLVSLVGEVGIETVLDQVLQLRLGNILLVDLLEHHGRPDHLELLRILLQQEGQQLLVKGLVHVEFPLGHVPGSSVGGHHIGRENLE